MDHISPSMTFHNGPATHELIQAPITILMDQALELGLVSDRFDDLLHQLAVRGVSSRALPIHTLLLKPFERRGSGAGRGVCTPVWRRHRTRHWVCTHAAPLAFFAIPFASVQLHLVKAAFLLMYAAPNAPSLGSIRVRRRHLRWMGCKLLCSGLHDGRGARCFPRPIVSILPGARFTLGMF